MDAIKYLLERYEIGDLANENAIGIFRNGELQELFNTLVESGKKGQPEALNFSEFNSITDYQGLYI